MVFYVYADLCSLLAATSQLCILIGQNMQLTGCCNGNEMRNATCADTQISIEWHYCSFLYCDQILCFFNRNGFKLATVIVAMIATSLGFIYPAANAVALMILGVPCVPMLWKEIQR